MKYWIKTNGWNFGETILSWRHRDAGKLFGKFLSWVLGAFVFGLLTSIFFSAIGIADIAQPAARLVFFAILFIGVLSNFYRAILNGYEYKITQQALVFSHPFFGWEKLGTMIGSEEKPFRHIYYYLEWQDVQEIRELQTRLILVMKDENEIEIPVHDVLKVELNLNLNKPEPKAKGSSKSDRLAYDKAVLKMVLQTAREARRVIVNSKKAE